MVNFPQVEHHPAVQAIAENVAARANNKDIGFFRLVAAHFLGLPASIMHAKVRNRGEDFPINTYMLAIAKSGAGKGVSTGAMRDVFTKPFRLRFKDEVMPEIAKRNLFKMAQDIAINNNTKEDDEFARLEKAYDRLGAYMFSFDSGSTPAAKQQRDKILMAGIGSLNLVIDEIGKNIEGNSEVLSTFLELYDKGYMGNKAKVSSADNKRELDLEGMSPANLFAFGEPTAVFDGGSVEKAFRGFLEAGYARRFIFAYGDVIPMGESLTDEELYDLETQQLEDPSIHTWIDRITELADPAFHNWVIEMPREVGIMNVQYRRHCQALAQEMGTYESVQRAEMRHRYFKVMKLAGAYAFFDQVSTMTEDHYLMAMKLVEESGEAFQALLRQERNSEKLARYIAEKKIELTKDDLQSDLPFYPSSKGPQELLMDMAVAWGYKNHTIIKKTWQDGIQFFQGESLEETSLKDVKFSFSDDYAYRYAVNSEPVAFEDLHKLTQAKGIHWANHAFDEGHRHEEKVIPGFNMIVLDIDGGASLDMVHDVLSDYVFMTSTTKRHTAQENRFRLILPTNYQIKLDKADYRKFMNSLMEWLPIPDDALDLGANQRSKKWEANPSGNYYYSEGTDLLDILPFVPKTSRNEEYQKQNKELQSMDSFERWFAEKWQDGNRNNLMLKFALGLLDSGLSYNAVEDRVLTFNSQLPDGLSPDELKRTVLVTVAQRAAGTP